MTERAYPYPILVVDDEPAILDVMTVNLEKKNCIVHTAQTGREAFDRVEANDYSVIILDYSLPDTNGFHILKELKKRAEDALVIMITAHGSIEMAVECMKAGAFNYLVKPINYDEMSLLVNKAIEHHSLLTELFDLRKQLDDRYALGNMVGNSKKMLKIYEKVKIVAESDATVLIRGETGTGKELVAKAVHHHSTRHSKNFVRVNCAAIPETLLEAELFGHEKGAFTGAVAQKMGKFERANGGTILLDEISEISPTMQAKLLRILQDGEFDRVGGHQTFKVDTRVIGTTNRNLEKAIEENRFRQDLFYRLNVIPIYIPALRERKEDIPLLINHFIQKFSEKNSKEIKAISPSVVASLMQYDWPGNVRELENVIERAVVLSPNGKLDDVEIPVGGNDIAFGGTSGRIQGFQAAKKTVIESFEINYLTQILKKHKGNISAAAKEAGLDYKNFHDKLKKYQMKKRQFED